MVGSAAQLFYSFPLDEQNHCSNEWANELIKLLIQNHSYATVTLATAKPISYPRINVTITGVRSYYRGLLKMSGFNTTQFIIT